MSGKRTTHPSELFDKSVQKLDNDFNENLCVYWATVKDSDEITLSDFIATYTYKENGKKFYGD